MRWTSLARGSVLLVACHTLVACGDGDDGTGGGGAGGQAGTNNAGSAGKATGGDKNQGGSDSKAGSGGGGAGTAGSVNEGGEGGAPEPVAGSAGMGGMPPAPECTKDADCADDLNPCTDEKCTDGKCGHPANTATCDDGNGCTGNDKCTDGACKGTNTTDACDDLSSCTSGDKCTNGACVGTNDAVMCPACAGPDNLVKNCDFSMGTDNWNQSFDDGAQGSQTVVNGHLVVNITADGANPWSIQPRQEMLPIKKGMKYKLSFLAGASVNRTMFIAITQNHADYLVYSDDGYTVNLEKQMKPYSFTFTANKADDANMKIEIRLGKNDANAAANDVYFDDFVFMPIKCTDTESCTDGNVCTTDVCGGDGICTHTNNTEACAADTDPCTADVCAAGACTHPAGNDNTACAPDADDCTADLCKAGVCDHSFSQDLCPACTLDVHCDDHESCTEDKCTTGVCSNTPITGACDDGNACTTGDACDAGTCAPGTANTDACEDDDPCTVQNMCAASECGPGLNFCDDCTVAGNMLNNCNFATDATGWLEGFFGGGLGSQTVENGMLAVTTTTAGPANWAIQPRQAGVVLVKDQWYIVSFKAKATIARNMQLSLTEDGGGFVNYSGGAHDFALTTELQHFSFTFQMKADPPPVTENVKFEMDLGGDANNPTLPNTVYLDEFSLRPIAAPTP